jgi:hypothetical protein
MDEQSKLYPTLYAGSLSKPRLPCSLGFYELYPLSVCLSMFTFADCLGDCLSSVNYVPILNSRIEVHFQE